MKLRLFFIGWMIFCSISIAQARPPVRHHFPSSSAIYNDKMLAKEINRILEEVRPHATVGIRVKSMRNGKVIYSKNEHQLLMPASILKILTAEAALLYLGPEYRFSTDFLTDAKSMTHGTVHGNLYLVHSGDPSLTYYDLTDLMATLKSQQIHTVTGNVYIDTTAYDQVQYGPGWVWDDTRYCYAAPISASIIDHNCLPLKIVPAKAIGKAANIIPNPRYYYSGIENGVITRGSHSPTCYIHLGVSDKNMISISGCMPKGHYSRGVSTVITNVSEYDKNLVKNLFNRFGIQVEGTVLLGAASKPTLSPIASHASKPLHHLITDMLKKSDNIIAGSLFKKIGELYTHQPGSWKNGSLAVKDILFKQAAINSTQMNIIDGSGLSRDNLITPAQMMQVLDFAYHNDKTNYEFISALPIAGVDGTLKRRLSNIPRKVRAKTGTMSGVVSLAGYALSKNKESLAFVIIFNDQNGNGWKYRELEDKIVTALTHYSHVN